MARQIQAMVLALIFTVVAPDTILADENSRATPHGRIDLSYGCPKNSVWVPRNGGECLSCPGGRSLVLSQCRRVILPVLERAEFVYRRKIGKKCRTGTFRAGITRRCHRCREGLQHEDKLPVEIPGVCYSLKVIQSEPARVVAKVSPQTLLDPKTVISEVNTLGCRGYGKDAFFDPTDGGSCWSCPKSHPTRTLYRVNGNRACAIKECGKLGRRPCYVWERFPSCDPGLLEDPFKNKCIRTTDFACRAAIESAKRISEMIEEANRLGKALEEAALERIPGLAAAKRFAQNQGAQMQRQMAKVTEQLPVEQVVADLKAAFPTPEAAEQVNRIAAALASRAERIEQALLIADKICSGDGATLQTIFDEALAEAGITPDGGATSLAEILGPAKAHAAMGRLLVGWTIAYSLAPVVNARVNGVTIPMQLFGLQVAFQVGETKSENRVAVFMTFGLDVISVPPPEMAQLGALERFITFSWPEQVTLCDTDWGGTGLVVLDRIGFAFGCNGFSSMSLKFSAHDRTRNPNPTIDVVDAAELLKETFSSVRVDRRKWKASPAVTFGPNVAIRLFPRGGSIPQIGFAQ